MPTPARAPPKKAPKIFYAQGQRVVIWDIRDQTAVTAELCNALKSILEGVYLAFILHDFGEPEDEAHVIRKELMGNAKSCGFFPVVPENKNFTTDSQFIRRDIAKFKDLQKTPSNIMVIYNKYWNGTDFLEMTACTLEVDDLPFPASVCHLVWEEVLFICLAGCRVEEELSSDRFRKWLAETVEHSKDLKGIFLLGWLEGREVDLQRKTAIRPKDQEVVKPFLDLIEDNCLTNLWIHRQNCFLLSAQDFQVQVHHEVFTQRMGEEFKNDPILFRLKEVDTVPRPWGILESATDGLTAVKLKDEPPEY